jgi:hypothetical protein
MATRIQKASFADAYDLRIKTQWMQGYGEPEHEFQQIYNMVNKANGTGSDERYSHITPFGRWEQKDPVTNSVPMDTVYQGYDVTITPYTYWMGFTIDQETWEDDPSGLLGGNLATALAQAGRHTLEYLAALPFNNHPTSLTSTTQSFSPWMTGGDGYSLLNTQHPIVTGGVYSNVAGTAIDLSVAALQASYPRLAKMPNYRGLQWPMTGQTLVVPADSHFLVREILETTGKVDTNYNTINSVKGMVTPFEWSQLTDTDAWFVLANKAGGVAKKGHQLTCVMRISPEFDRDNVFENGDRRYKGRFRVGFGYPDWRGVDGSMGA